MRIIGGSFRGRSISAPKGMVARPTTDRVREALFSMLIARPDVDFDQAKIIDVFAGSGALGLEALSRGANHCLFVEIDADARAAIRGNIETLSLFGSTRIHKRSALALGTLPSSAGGPFDIAFLDPPYGEAMVPAALDNLANGGWLRPNAIVIVEQRKGEALPDNVLFTISDNRTYGDTQISILTYCPQR